MKLNPEVFERAARLVFREWPNRGCCSSIADVSNLEEWTASQAVFYGLFKSADRGHFGYIGCHWWPIEADGDSATPKNGLEPRLLALLLAAEVCRDELNPKRHHPAKKAREKQDAWAKKTPHERLSDLVGAAEAARISKGRK